MPKVSFDGRVLVTGAAGFIGSTLVKHLIDLGASDVVGVDSFTDYYSPAQKRANIASIDRSSFELVEGDLLTLDLEHLLEGVSHIFHQAGQPGVRTSWGQEFGHYTRNNVEVTQALLEASRSAKDLRAFVYASSSSVYGDAETYPTHETTLPAPQSPYGVSKLSAEHLCSLYARNFEVPTVSLRYFTVYGPGQRPDMAFHRFIRAAIEEEEITVFGDGEQVREFTFVGDIVEANVLAATSAIAPGTVINLSGGSSVTVNEVLAIVCELAGKELNLRYMPTEPGDVRRTGGSTSKARALLGWSPKVVLRDGLEQEFAWIASGVVPR